jgi:signal transduction histidine kinase
MVSSTQKRRIRQLSLRIFMQIISLLMIVIISVGLVVGVFGGEEEWHDIADQVAVVATDSMVPGDAEQTMLRERLRVIEKVVPAELAVYTVDGKELAASGESPPLPITEAEARRLSKKQFVFPYVASDLSIPLPKRPGYVDAYIMFDWDMSGRGLNMALSIGVVIVVIALMAYPLARAIVGPIDRLTETASIITKGDLSARSKLVHKGVIGVLATAMDRMAEQLEKRITREKELLANISHEIRSPLARIKVALELCTEDDATDVEIKERLSAIEEDVDELERLIEDVFINTKLDYASSGGQPNAFVLRRELVEVEATVKDSQKRFEFTHPNHQLIVKVERGLPYLHVDPALFRRVFHNLLDNAAKYSPKDQPVELEVTQGGEEICVEIRDRGIGIPEEDLERVFEPFFRTDRSRAPETGGTGLGLTLSKRIIDSHGGRLVAMNREGGGTQFQILFDM